MAAKLVNKSKTKADINLYSGKRAVLLPNSSFPLDEEITPKVEKYYANLRAWNIFLVKDHPVEVKPVKEERLEPVEVNPQVEPEVKEEILEAEEVVTELVEPVKQRVQVEYTEAELMSKRHAELVEIAESLGLTFDIKSSKKELSRLILGGE